MNGDEDLGVQQLEQERRRRQEQRDEQIDAPQRRVNTGPDETGLTPEEFYGGADRGDEVAGQGYHQQGWSGPSQGFDQPSGPAQGYPTQQPPTPDQAQAGGPIRVSGTSFTAPPSNAFRTAPLPDPEAGLRRAQQAVAQATLSYPEQLRLQRLQNASTEIDDAVANGSLSQQDAAQFRQRIAQEAQPLHVRASQLPLLMQRLQFEQAQHQAAQQAAIAEHTQRYYAQTAQQRLQVVTMPDGSQRAFMPDPHGRLHELEMGGDGRAQQQQERQRVQQEQRYNTALNAGIRHYEGVVRQEMRPLAGTTQVRHPEDWGEAGPVQSDNDEIHRIARQRAHRALESAGIRAPQVERPGSPSSPGQIQPPTAPGSTHGEQQAAFDRIIHTLANRQTGSTAPAAQNRPAPERRPDNRSWWQWFVEHSP